LSTLDKRNPIAKAVKFALLAGATVSAFSAPATFAAEEEVEEERITITGSRIKRVDVEGANPVTVVSREDILRTGVTNVGELLQRLPEVTGSPLNTTVNNGGNGAVTVDMRGLGRTLTLVNGRRTPDGGDFQTIPAAMIERVEILKDGASAVYGSDAMAGVVNIITRKDFEGVQLQTQYSNYDGVASGAGDLAQMSLVMGATGEKSHFVVGLDWNKQEQIYQGDTPWNFMQNSFFMVPNEWGLFPENGDTGYTQVGFGSSRIPGGNFNLGSGAGGCGSVMFEGGNSVSGLPANYRCYNGTWFDPANDSYNYAPSNYLQTPYERTNIFVEAGYDINSDTRVYSEIRFNDRTSRQELAPMPYDSTFDPSWGVGGAAIAAGNYFNPFGEDVTRARRRVVESTRAFNQDISQYQYVFGVEGSIDDNWSYDVSYNKGKRQRVDISQGQWVSSRVSQALGPSFYDAATDSVVCGTAGNPIDDCVSMNMFGGPGNITQEMLDYVGADLVESSTSSLEIINAVVSGDVMDLPAGTWGVAAGYEWRKVASAYVPDSGLATDAVTGNTGAGVAGDYINTSYFLETVIPVLSDVPLVKSLEISYGVRFDDYNLGFDNTSSQLGVRWTVTDELLLRSTFGESFRAPGVGELFSPLSDTFPPLQDPCNAGNWANLNSDAQANCVANGVPAGGYVQTDSQIRGRVGGNPDLQPETGESLTVGLAWSPSFLDGFNMTLDYWDIQIDDVISSLSMSTLLANCAQIGASCDKINRFSDGRIDFVESNSTNLGQRTAKGIDANFKYGFDTEIGRFNLNLLYSRLLERVENEFVGTRNPWALEGKFDDLTQGGAYPENKAQIAVDWSQGDWSASYSIDFIGSVVANYSFLGYAGQVPGQPLINTLTGEFILDNEGNIQNPDVQSIDSQLYHDVVVNYTVTEGAQVSFGITNLTDEAPPFIDSGFNASTDPGTYRLFGRGLYLRAILDF